MMDNRSSGNTQQTVDVKSSVQLPFTFLKYGRFIFILSIFLLISGFQSLNTINPAGQTLAAAVAEKPSISYTGKTSAKKTNDEFVNGSGFMVTSDGCLLTCAHVVAGASKIVARIQQKDYEASLVAIDSEQDLALLKVESGGFAYLQIEDSSQVKSSDMVASSGQLLSDEWIQNTSNVWGKVDGVDAAGPVPLLHLNVPLNPGFSGGPVVNETGAVVGIFNAKFTGPNIFIGSYAVEARQAVPFLKKCNVSYTKSITKSRIDPATFANRIHPAIALIRVTVKLGDKGVWKAERPVMIWRKPLENNASMAAAMDITSDGKTIAMAREKFIDLLNTSDAKAQKLLTGHPDNVNVFCFSPDNSLLASGGWKNSVILWDTKSGMMVRELTSPPLKKGRNQDQFEIRKLTFSSDGHILAALPLLNRLAYNDSINVWDVETGEIHSRIDPDIDYIGDIFFIQSTHQLLVYGNSLNKPKHLCLCDADTGKLLKTWAISIEGTNPNERLPIDLATLSPKGNLLAFYPVLSPMPGNMYLAEYPDTTKIKKFSQIVPKEIRFSLDQSIMLAHHTPVLAQGRVALIETSSGTLVWDIVGDGNCRYFVLTADGKSLYRYNYFKNALEMWDISCIYGAKPQWINKR